MDTLEFMLNLLAEIEDENFLSNIFGLTLKNELLCKNCKNVRGPSKEQFSISISFQQEAKIFIYDFETKKTFEVNLGVFFMYSYEEVFKKISDNLIQVKCHHDNDILIDNRNNSTFQNNQESFNSKLLDKYNERENSNERLILILLNDEEVIENHIEINKATATPLKFHVSLYDALLIHGKAEMMEIPCKCGKEKIQQRFVFEQINNYFIIKINRKSDNNLIFEVPLKNMEMKYFFTEEQSKNSFKFYLFATIDHYGSSRGGHYLAKLFDKNVGKWYIFNDSSCYEENENDIKVNRNSIILIYKKEGS